MALYSLLLFRDGERVRNIDNHYLEDLDALDAAYGVSGGHSVEVWQGARLVARVKQGNAAITVEDRLSG